MEKASPLMMYFQTPIQKGIKQGMGNGFVAASFVYWDHLIFKDLKRYVTMIDFLVLWYYYTILKVFFDFGVELADFKNWSYTLNYSSKNTRSNSQVETMWEAIKLITLLKGLSQEMGLAFDDIYG